MKVNHKELRKVTITSHILSANTTIKFPCFFTLLWKASDNSFSKETEKVEAISGCAQFNETLSL